MNTPATNIPTSRRTGRRIAEIFYERDPSESNMYKCSCGIRRKKSGISYQNLIAHGITSYPTYMQLLDSTDALAQAHLEKYLTNPESENIYGWLDLIINASLPFSVVESKIFRKHVKHDAPCTEKFMKYMTELTMNVENKIAQSLPTKFALVSDGWPHHSTHYASVFS